MRFLAVGGLALCLLAPQTAPSVAFEGGVGTRFITPPLAFALTYAMDTRMWADAHTTLRGPLTAQAEGAPVDLVDTGSLLNPLTTLRSATLRANTAPTAANASVQRVKAEIEAPARTQTPPLPVAKPKVKPKPQPRLVARINLSTQRMAVMLDGKTLHSWRISSGRRGHHTPTGTYKPYRMHTMWYSRKYDNAPMPHAIFFRGGYAVHATYATRMLGRPASHGCIRLSPKNARRFFQLVRKYGKHRTRIALHGSTPASRGFAKRRRPRRTYRNNYDYQGWDTYQRRSYRQRRARARRPQNNGFFSWLD
ncbi:MAG: L,D-transpeptidase [Pseudomonadota bacterium]